MFKEFIQNFVIYHGCGAWYYDGTNKILNKNRRCILPNYKPFWEKPNDVRNKVETRTQLKLKSIVTNDYIRRYFKSINAFDKNKGCFSTDDESTDDESIKANSYKPNTEQFNTGEKLVIEENTVPDDTVQSETISNTQNPDNKNNTKN